MFGIGLPELLLILGLGLIVLGPEKMPELARSLAKGLVELKKTAETLKESMQEELREGEKALLEEGKKAGVEQQWRGLDGQGAAPSDLLPDEFGTLAANSAPATAVTAPIPDVEAGAAAETVPEMAVEATIVPPLEPAESAAPSAEKGAPCQ